MHLTSNGGMKIVDSNPPEWIMQGCMNQFRLQPGATVWTYGDTIFAPGRTTLPDHIIAHEEQHHRQQSDYQDPLHDPEGTGADGWWRRFLRDPRFRLEQEAEAYGMQYRFFCDKVKDRNRRALFLMQIAGQLSGPLYQVAVSTTQARQMIEVLSVQKQLP